MENTEIFMENFTSLAARNALGNVKAIGQIAAAQAAWVNISVLAASADSGDRL